MVARAGPGGARSGGAVSRSRPKKASKHDPPCLLGCKRDGLNELSARGDIGIPQGPGADDKHINGHRRAVVQEHIMDHMKRGK